LLVFDIGNKSRKRDQRYQSNILLIFKGFCREIDDDMRWLIALISDTGLRLGEAAGLERSHVDLSAEVPHVIVEETDNRRLKTKTSKRRVPLGWLGSMGR